jgi:tetratricopeptide (TPR) repeat protein
MGLSEEDALALTRLGDVLERGTFYELFDIPREHDRNELRQAYYALSRQWHPDRFYRQDLEGREELLEQVFAGINLAYRTLDDPEERTKYDRELILRGLAKGAPRKPPPPRSKRRSGPVEVGADEGADDTHTVHVDVGRKVKATSEPAEGATKKKRKKRKKKKESSTPPPAGVLGLKKQLIKRLRKAKTYYEAGQADLEANNVLKAASSFYLASQYDPRNDGYKAAYEEANGKARSVQAQQFVGMARSAEDYGSHREAIVYYQKAVELDPPDGIAFYRLGRLLRRLDATDRAALDNLRTAVAKTKNKVDYRVALAECFEDHSMKLNAHREYKAALELDPGNETAKTGLKRTR